jgi:hypothetical protein
MELRGRRVEKEIQEVRELRRKPRRVWSHRT